MKGIAALEYKHQGWKKMQNFPGIWSKIVSKCNFFTNFQIFMKEKDRNIHLNDTFPLKIAKISLQKHIFPRNEITKFHIFTMHELNTGLNNLNNKAHNEMFDTDWNSQRHVYVVGISLAVRNICWIFVSSSYVYNNNNNNNTIIVNNNNTTTTTTTTNIYLGIHLGWPLKSLDLFPKGS